MPEARRRSASWTTEAAGVATRCETAWRKGPSKEMNGGAGTRGTRQSVAAAPMGTGAGGRRFPASRVAGFAITAGESDDHPRHTSKVRGAPPPPACAWGGSGRCRGKHQHRAGRIRNSEGRRGAGGA